MSTSFLLIEDNPDNMELMRFLLSAAGYESRCEFSGQAGIAAASAVPADVILLDVHMPNMDGFETLSRLRRIDGVNGAPIIAITAFAMEEDRTRILAAGFDGYISKPIAPETFVAEVERIAGLAGA